ncbi:EIF5B [Cordylochernes scorpioides]|uniref:Eukaryotic translation initiation factor 5B n=1 Tax=Cordylochernes scorpioides TaxID=51811 RepID=A0ABY6LJK1_9ARAC|nr:EIF5B [Cordylochernes scorpioides]
MGEPNVTSKKKDKKKNKVAFKEESDEDEPLETTSKLNVGVKNKGSVFGMLSMDDEPTPPSTDDEKDEIKPVKKPEQPQQPKQEDKGKKSKKKERKKKKDEDDEELDRLLEELALENQGKKPTPTAEVEEKAKSEVPEADTDKSKSKKSKTKKQDSLEKEDKEAVKEEAAKEVKTESTEAQDDDSTVKTAAQKRKEKKERERLKKLQQNQQVKKKQTAATESADPVIESQPPESAEAEQEEAEEDDDDKKKKDKKKKKGAVVVEDDKKDKKKPGKKQISAIQERLKLIKELEEQQKREEEELEKARLEAERLQEEKLRQEQERKERKKQKEKERKERLKAEGKLLSKVQRQKRERMEAQLASLKMQGVEVPQIGEKRERPKYDKRRPAKKKPEESAENKEAPKEEVVTPEPKIEPKVDSAPAKEKEEETDDVKDTWDASSDDDDSNSQENAANKQDDKSIEAGDENAEDKTDSEDSSSEDDDSDDDEEELEDTKKQLTRQRIQKQHEEAEKKRDINKLRSPIICVLGHVDTGKTKILDKIRHSNVQDSEAGGITQQIGATMVPKDAIMEQCKMAKGFSSSELKLPGLLIIDTPGHESFSNLRSRGSSQCDIAILVVDIMHGLEPQTIESINILKKRKTPFVVALNKVDRLYDWKKMPNRDIQEVMKAQTRMTKSDFEERTKSVQLQFSEQGLNTALYYENTDVKSYVSLVPTSAITGDGMGNLMSLIVEYSQTLLAKKLSFSEELQATVLEVKAIPGLGTTIDVILINGRLREGETMVVAGQDGPIVTQIRSLLMPEPLKELRVKNHYKDYKVIEGAQGVKITAKELEKAIAGLPLLVAKNPDEVEILKEEVDNALKETLKSFKTKPTGVLVQASTLGSLEALIEFLTSKKIPYSNVKVGPVSKKDVMKASAMLQHDPQYALILAFDVPTDREAEDLAKEYNIRIFTANIIYHLFDRFTEYQEDFLNRKREEYKHVAIFPCKLRILPQYIFNSRDPIVMGVSVEAGQVKEGALLCVPSKEGLEIGRVTTIEFNHKPVEIAKRGQEVCIKVEPIPGEAPKMYNRHFEATDMLVSKISRESIDALKKYFRTDLTKTDWQLVLELKKVFDIM